MTARTIANISFDSWIGQFHPPMVPVTPFVRSGVSGVGATKGAAQPQRVDVIAKYLDDDAGVESVKTALEALTGTFITASDDRDNEYDHTLVQSIVCTINPAVGDAEAILTCVAVLWPDDMQNVYGPT